ncbi:sigma-70 family RNA polymerase sigma factor [Salininema proteolyticum]|uniref:Sigma-70 family RNA polymerase sigma factor n=1 Tax=Salininema proteolyticum TaxID=1607685 RepID=A0ABV8U1X5_9ACTN
MAEEKDFTTRFEEHRGRMRAVAYRMLGSLSEADDAVQEAWLKASRADTGNVENPAGWLTTVIGRVCLDMLRSRKSRREDFTDGQGSEPAVRLLRRADPEEEALLADSVGLALLVVLDALSPAERLAFVLHDMFSVPFTEIAPIVERTPETTQRLASRARRRVRGRTSVDDGDRMKRYQAVDAFLRAARDGEFEALLSLLDPNATYRPDETAFRIGGVGEVSGARNLAELLSGQADPARPVFLDGEVGVVVAPRGKLLAVWRLVFDGGLITEINAVAGREELAEAELAVPDRENG